MSAVVPLDPNSPKGIATAERITQTFAEIWLNICARRQAAAADTVKPGTPPPSPPPTGPTGPRPRLTQTSQRAAAAIAA